MFFKKGHAVTRENSVEVPQKLTMDLLYEAACCSQADPQKLGQGRGGTHGAEYRSDREE